MENNDFDIICFCNNIKRSEIIDAINKKGATSQPDIERITGASSRCGRCKKRVVSIVEEVLKNK